MPTCYTFEQFCISVTNFKNSTHCFYLQFMKKEPPPHPFLFFLQGLIKELLFSMWEGQKLDSRAPLWVSYSVVGAPSQGWSVTEGLPLLPPTHAESGGCT